MYFQRVNFNFVNFLPSETLEKYWYSTKEFQKTPLNGRKYYLNILQQKCDYNSFFATV